MEAMVEPFVHFLLLLEHFGVNPMINLVPIPDDLLIKLRILLVLFVPALINVFYFSFIFADSLWNGRILDNHRDDVEELREREHVLVVVDFIDLVEVGLSRLFNLEVDRIEVVPHVYL